MYYINLFLPFIFILGSAVILHEFGHFIVAKLQGMRVETFSFGFGPRLFGHKWGTTDYRVSLVPLGGYVKLGGDESNASIEGESSENIPEAERFDLRPRWQKISGDDRRACDEYFDGARHSVHPPRSSSAFPPRPRRLLANLNKTARQKSPDSKQVIASSPLTAQRILLGSAFMVMRISRPERPLPLTVERDGQQLQLSIKPVEACRERRSRRRS